MKLEVWTLQAVMPHAAARVYRFLDAINETLQEYDITSPLRVAMFLAQIAHESGELRYTRELWGPTPQQMRYERVPAAPWVRGDAVNAVAFDLGNTEAGDGMRYMGRGLIQITGRANYLRLSADMYGKGSLLLDNPEQLEQVGPATKSAGVFWRWRNLNQYADAEDLQTCTRRINGGLTHYDKRAVYYARAKKALA